MITKKLKIEGDNKHYFQIRIELNRVYIQIVKRGYELDVAFTVPYYIQRFEDDTMKNPTDYKHIHIKKKDFDLPTILHGAYQEYLELKVLEDEIFKPISNENMKTIEFGITQAGEEDYIP